MSLPRFPAVKIQKNVPTGNVLRNISIITYSPVIGPNCEFKVFDFYWGEMNWVTTVTWHSALYCIASSRVPNLYVLYQNAMLFKYSNNSLERPGILNGQLWTPSSGRLASNIVEAEEPGTNLTKISVKKDDIEVLSHFAGHQWSYIYINYDYLY